jgi:hypothetical protein
VLKTTLSAAVPLLEFRMHMASPSCTLSNPLTYLGRSAFTHRSFRTPHCVLYWPELAGAWPCSSAEPPLSMMNPFWWLRRGRIGSIELPRRVEHEGVLGFAKGLADSEYVIGQPLLCSTLADVWTPRVSLPFSLSLINSNSNFCPNMQKSYLYF